MKKVIAMLALATGLVFTGNNVMAQQAESAKVMPANVLKWNEVKHDFGTLTQNVPAPVAFEFTNTGKTPITLATVQGSCGCTATDYTKEPVAPGKKGKVNATYNAAALGNFTKTITVTTNTGEKHVLSITGKVEGKDQKTVN